MLNLSTCIVVSAGVTIFGQIDVIEADDRQVVGDAAPSACTARITAIAIASLQQNSALICGQRRSRSMVASATSVDVTWLSAK